MAFSHSGYILSTLPAYNTRRISLIKTTTVGVENVIKKSAKALFKTKGLIQNSTLN